MTTQKQTTIIKLNGLNYQVWKFQIQKVIKNKKLDKVVYEAIKQEDATKQELVDKDNEAQELLATSVEANIIQKILNCKSSFEIWSRLKTIYELTGDCNLENLLHAFFTIKMKEDEEVASFIGKVEELSAEIISSGENISERMIRARVIGGLSSKFEGFSRAWNATNSTDRTLTNLINRLIQDESEMKNRFAKEDAPTALIAQGDVKNIPQYARRDKRSGRCNYAPCGKLGHWERECRLKARHIREGKNIDAQRTFALMAATFSQSYDTAWYGDSGASCHMSNDRSIFSEYTPSTTPTQISVGNAGRLNIQGSGKIEFHSILADGTRRDVTLLNVQYVPGISHNLVSIGQAAKENNWAVFKGCKCEILTRGKNVIIMEGNQDKATGLFKMNIQPVVRTALLASSVRTQMEWHKALGHLNQGQISDMAKQNAVEGMFIDNKKEESLCTDCMRGKGCLVSHPTSSRIKALTPGEAVHADLIGPITPPSLAGSIYVLLLTDEYSGYRNAYFIKTKDEVCKKIEEYITAVEVETGYRLKTIYSDCGTEFLNNKVRTILDIEHVRLLTSSPYTPAQNGTAERSNRTMIESTRSMLSAAKLPKELWCEAFNTAVYTLNRTTTSSSRDKTPFERWTNRKPNIAHFQVWGSPVQVLVKPRNVPKWEPKTVQGYMVGYTHKSNTYRCYLPDDNKVKTTCDIIFEAGRPSDIHKTTELPHQPTNTWTCTNINCSSELVDQNSIVPITNNDKQSPEPILSETIESPEFSNLTLNKSGGPINSTLANQETDKLSASAAVHTNRPPTNMPALETVPINKPIIRLPSTTDETILPRAIRARLKTTNCGKVFWAYGLCRTIVVQGSVSRS